MGLYCLKCGVWAYKTHKCNIMTLVPLTPECVGLANKMYALGLELLSAGCFVTQVVDSLYDHRITFDVELKHQIPPILALPPKWSYYTEIIGTDFQISVIGYSELYTWDGVNSPSERCQQIADDFSVYLSTLDKIALEAVLTLYNTGVGGARYAR